jgi:hypothetical protein
MDNGYFSADAIELLENSDIAGYIAAGKEGRAKDAIENSNRRIGKNDFEYNENSDSYQCPAGNDLRLKSSTAEKQIYQAQTDDCQHCDLKDCCTTSKNGRSLTVDEGEPIRKKMREKMQSTEYEHNKQGSFSCF